MRPHVEGEGRKFAQFLHIFEKNSQNVFTLCFTLGGRKFNWGSFWGWVGSGWGTSTVVEEMGSKLSKQCCASSLVFISGP